MRRAIRGPQPGEEELSDYEDPEDDVPSHQDPKSGLSGNKYKEEPIGAPGNNPGQHLGLASPTVQRSYQEQLEEYYGHTHT